VLQKVRHAVDVGGLVAGAGADEETHGDRARGRARFADDRQAVGQNVVVEGHGGLQRGSANRG